MSGTVVVTGGRGFIAHHLADSLVRQGRRVLVYDLPAVGPAPEVAGASYVDGDVRDLDRLSAALPSDVDTVYHLAAVVGVDRYLEDPSAVHDVNVLGTRNVVEVAAARGASLVFGSTSEVYGKNPTLPWHESSDSVLGSTENARWCYAASKIMAEHLIRDLAAKMSVPWTILRLFNVYGPLQRPDFVISRSIHRGLNGLPLELHNGGGQTRCFTYIDDVVDAIVRAGELGDGSTLNIGSDVETTVSAAVLLVRDALAMPGLEVRVVDRALGEGGFEDVPRRVPAVEQAYDRLGWRAGTDLATGLAATVAWARRATWWRSAPVAGRIPVTKEA